MYNVHVRTVHVGLITDELENQTVCLNIIYLGTEKKTTENQIWFHN